MIELLRELKNRHILNIDANKGRHYCDNCLSTGINPDEVGVYEPCFSCAGHGHLTWIENATQHERTDIDKETVEICTLNNVVQTMSYLIRSLRRLKVGHATIQINFEGVDKDNKTVEKLKHLLECYDLM